MSLVARTPATPRWHHTSLFVFKPPQSIPKTLSWVSCRRDLNTTCFHSSCAHSQLVLARGRLSEPYIRSQCSDQWHSPSQSESRYYIVIQLSHLSKSENGESKWVSMSHTHDSSCPTSRGVTHTHTITLPPPCFIVFLVNLKLQPCPGFLQHHWWPSEPIRLNFDSSENITAYQSFFSQWQWFSPHSLHFLWCAAVRRGFF